MVSQLTVSGSSLDRLSHTWESIEEERGARGADLLNAARTAEKDAAKLSTEMSEFQVEITTFEQILKRHSKEVNGQLGSLFTELSTLEMQHQIAQVSLAALTAQLRHEQDRADDADSILLGIVSFGGTAIARVIKIKKLRNAAVVQMQQLAANQSQLRAKVAKTNEVKHWIDETVRITGSINQAEAITTAYHNRLSNVIGDLGDAVDDEEKVLTTTREKVAAYYERQVGKELMAVFASA